MVLDNHKEWLDNMDLINEASDHQSGFRKSHLLDPCLFFYIKKDLKGFDDCLLIWMISIDFQKVFDTINQNNTFKEIKSCWYDTVKWFQYLLSVK